MRKRKPATSNDLTPAEHDAIARRNQAEADDMARGWYHTGTDSYDYPEIKHFDRGPEHGPEVFTFNHGPFLTFQEAKKDFLAMLRRDIEMLRYCAANVRTLKRPTRG